MKTFAPFLAVLGAASASAQTVTQVPLNYNFNGIVHAGESGVPDDPNGFRSISDRALDFSGGVPADVLLNSYSLIGTAGALDIVHLGNRDTVDFGNRPFDTVANGDDFGIQPAWLTTVDQSTPQTTTLASPIALAGTSGASFLLQISNGGGSFEVVIGFVGGTSTTATIGAGDWFGGAYAGTGFTDSAFPDANLSITEATVDLTAFDGRSVSSITFQNGSNPNAGYAILACNIESGGSPISITSLPLNYNFNGIVHAGEGQNPDDPIGYRSISDRGLDFTGGIPSNPVSDDFALVGQAGVLDIVHLGDRNTVSGGVHAFDPVANGDLIGTQPTWLANTNQTGPQTTNFANPVPISGAATGTVLFQISNGGGSFNVTYGFQSGATIIGNVTGPDWFGGTFLGTEQIDLGVPGANLNLNVGSIDLSGAQGELLTSITFSNSSNANSGVAILAANIESSGLGANYCTANPNSTGAPGSMSANGSNSVASNDITLVASSMPPLQFGIFVVSDQQGFVPVASGNLCLAGAIGRYQQPNEIFQINASGTAQLSIDISLIPRPNTVTAAQPGDTWYFQAWHRDFAAMSNTSNFTDGLAITFGN